MLPAEMFFFASLFFLAGVGLAHVGGLAVAFTALLSGGAFFVWAWHRGETHRAVTLAVLSFFIVAGAGYAVHFNRAVFSQNVPRGEVLTLEAVIINNPSGNISQGIIAELQPPYSGRIFLRLPGYQSLSYGDRLNIFGEIKELESPQDEYLLKDRVAGKLSYPQTEVVGRGEGRVWRAALYRLRNEAVALFHRILPDDEADLLGGITLGAKAEFSQEFKQAMSRSGTTHIVALSGYNIMIIVYACFSFLGLFLSRRWLWTVTVFLITAFVLATGAEASVTRAALMAILAILAEGSGRLYNTRNAIVFTGLVMVIINPHVLVFDVGFQLSFLALLGIVYLRPALARFWPGWLGGQLGESVRDNFYTTLSAQIMVAPVLIQNFGSASPVSLLANIVILEFIPLTMFLGFLVLGLYPLTAILSTAAAWLTGLFLRGEIFLINFFSQWSWPIHLNWRWPAWLVYYGAIGLLLWSTRRMWQRQSS